MIDEPTEPALPLRARSAVRDLLAGSRSPGVAGALAVCLGRVRPRRRAGRGGVPRTSGDDAQQYEGQRNGFHVASFHATRQQVRCRGSRFTGHKDMYRQIGCSKARLDDGKNQVVHACTRPGEAPPQLRRSGNLLLPNNRRSLAWRLLPRCSMGNTQLRRCALWVTPPVLHAAQELAELAGVDVDTFIEVVVLELREHEAREGALRSRAARRDEPGDGRVIPMTRARAGRRRQSN